MLDCYSNVSGLAVFQPSQRRWLINCSYERVFVTSQVAEALRQAHSDCLALQDPWQGSVNEFVLSQSHLDACTGDLDPLRPVYTSCARPAFLLWDITMSVLSQRQLTQHLASSGMLSCSSRAVSGLFHNTDTLTDAERAVSFTISCRKLLCDKDWDKVFF